MRTNFKIGMVQSSAITLAFKIEIEIRAQDAIENETIRWFMQIIVFDSENYSILIRIALTSILILNARDSAEP